MIELCSQQDIRFPSIFECFLSKFSDSLKIDFYHKYFIKKLYEIIFTVKMEISTKAIK